MPRIIPKAGMVGNLFSGHSGDTGWRAPTEMPDLSAYPMEAKFGFDSEFRYTTDSAVDAEVAGISICTPDKKKYYFPVGHRGGGNLDENSVKRWAKSNLAGRHLCILNAKDDVHVMNCWGLSLEDMDCKLHDPAFKAALLDENRKQYNLNLLLKEVIGREKADLPGQKRDIFDMSAHEVGSYAEQDAQDHLELDEAQQIQIDKEDLTRVCDLEDQLIYSTCSMERRGALIDVKKLDRWIREVDMAHQTTILELYSLSGMRINPNSGKDLKRLFDSLHLEYPRREEELGGDTTFEEEYFSRVDHPAVRLCITARKLHSLSTKYLRKYRKLLDYNSILRYNLHQLRTNNAEGSGAFGTVTGRYSSANINIQQVMKVESQLEEAEIATWIVRELFIPRPGKFYISADASQIEFRWFAHYSRSTRLIAEYVRDPTMDFHQLVANLLGQKRKDAKHNNFGKLYTMGITKLARRLGLSCNCGLHWDDQWKKSLHGPECRILKCFAISEEYDKKFPEALRLSKEAMNVAKKRGYVRTVMGRRRRYPTGERIHSALNAIIQGTAADTLKVKLLEVYNARAYLTIDLNATVHDELDGDIENPERKVDYKEALEAPDSRIPCDVPLLWEVNVGANWKECTA
jgi:DNA polymerase-1